MLPLRRIATAMQLCAAGLGGAVAPAPLAYATTVHTAATVSQAPIVPADAEATMHDCTAKRTDFEASPLAIRGRHVAPYGVIPATVRDPCALSHINGGSAGPAIGTTPSVPTVAALVQRAFGARITSTIRPMNATYGARYSWHKFGQALDFVPAGGVNAINRDQIRALMGRSGLRIIELLGPGDRGHANHWHVAFARPGQVIDRVQPVEGDDDWIVDVAKTNAPVSRTSIGAGLSPVPATAIRSAAKEPPYWDVFATAEWRTAHRGSS